MPWKHSTRSRTRAVRRVSDGKPRFDSPSVDNDVQVQDVDTSDDELSWEDVSDVPDEADNNVKLQHDTPTATGRPLGTTRRRRRVGNAYTRKLTAASVAINSSSSNTPTRRGKTTPPGMLQDARQPENGSNSHVRREMWDAIPQLSTHDVVSGAVRGVSFGIWYIFDITRTALTLLRKPLGFVLFLWILAMILSTVVSTFRAALAPVCWLPIISSSFVCRPIPLPPPRANYPRLMEAQTKTFEQLLDETSGGSAMSLEVKKAEMATSDLVTLVRISALHSKDLLASMLVDFVQDAKTTGRRLQKLHSRVGGSVDNIMAVNDHALRRIEEASSRTNIIDIIPWIESRKNRIVASTFKDAMDSLSAQISRLILEAEANIANLNDLEERLNALHDLVFREVKTVKGDRDELLAQLWTFLGGNRKELKNFNENLVILKNVGSYRSQARVHVTATLQTLQSLSEDMEELREKVATPGLVGECMPLEVQMKSIQYGLERLKANRIKARRTHDAAVEGVTGLGLDQISA
ncbi:hypothetical protein P691DRAFT_792480 [Macrolepiota fuliginosa MF-IS2]|uniref:Uncharacterized protein n=1 Tax=Macrolepiota fuliginosa MF-IS2 TaxID=1400762 RepID=A0A9P6BVP3_9AGAR|nr:hypothetical protein P691DRAFT_792480 [Macrolepiota fuliginosa MF-IS2]